MGEGLLLATAVSIPPSPLSRTGFINHISVARMHHSLFVRRGYNSS